MTKQENGMFRGAARRAMFAGVSVLGIMLASTSAQAQTPTSEDASSDTADSRAVDEIVVTARFKTKSLQDTPQAISAFGETQADQDGRARFEGSGGVGPERHHPAGILCPHRRRHQHSRHGFGGI